MIYAIVDLALNRLAFASGWTILWPLNGVSIAILLMRPRSDWPAILIGIGAGAGIGECMDGNSIRMELLLRPISLSEVTISALLLPHFSTLGDWLRKPHIFKRFLGALVLGPSISGVLAAIVFHVSAHQGYLSAFDDWAPSDALGIAVTMPLALSLRTPEMRDLFRPVQLLKTVSVLALAFLVAGLVFGVSRYPLLFLLYPALFLVESLLAFSGSAVAVLGVALIAVYLTDGGRGPFGVWPKDLPVSRDVAIQIYLGFQLLALFPASILLLERRRMAAELRDTNEQLMMLASLDGLTGIPNRRSLDERFAQEWGRAVRLQTPLGLVMIDIDHFKQFNDLYGHHAGDECLRAVASVLYGEVRRTHDHVARFGGEEFALLLPHTDVDGAFHMAEILRQAIVSLAIDHRGCANGVVTVSIGCAAMTPKLGDNRLSLLQVADAALYDAKRSGRNRVHIGETARQIVR
ncbi:Two-component response regulator [Granulicella sibirica]|uniref:diguanylate cyclase n=1 Tax=Granulicella sibirica TaxID=2479048 RepID=A0A4Q0T2A5_9BACT|nr:Two-component response regulator [Granulicella sibirica]